MPRRRCCQSWQTGLHVNGSVAMRCAVVIAMCRRRRPPPSSQPPLDACRIPPPRAHRLLLLLLQLLSRRHSRITRPGPARPGPAHGPFPPYRSPLADQPASAIDQPATRRRPISAGNRRSGRRLARTESPAPSAPLPHDDECSELIR